LQGEGNVTVAIKLLNWLNPGTWFFSTCFTLS